MRRHLKEQHKRSNNNANTSQDPGQPSTHQDPGQSSAHQDPGQSSAHQDPGQSSAHQESGQVRNQLTGVKRRNSDSSLSPKAGSTSRLLRSGSVFTSPTRRVALRNTPNAEQIEKYIRLISSYNKDVAVSICEAWKNVYYYFIDRIPEEGSPTFFPHIVSAVLYENANDTKIKGKDHCGKCVSVAGELKNTMECIDKALLALENDANVNEELFISLEVCFAEMKIHILIISDAINEIANMKMLVLNEEQKAGWCKVEKYILDEKLILTDDDRKALSPLRTCPDRDKTPKRLKRNDWELKDKLGGKRYFDLFPPQPGPNPGIPSNGIGRATRGVKLDFSNVASGGNGMSAFLKKATLEMQELSKALPSPTMAPGVDDHSNALLRQPSVLHKFDSMSNNSDDDDDACDLVSAHSHSDSDDDGVNFVRDNDDDDGVNFVRDNDDDDGVNFVSDNDDDDGVNFVSDNDDDDRNNNVRNTP